MVNQQSETMNAGQAIEFLAALKKDELSRATALRRYGSVCSENQCDIDKYESNATRLDMAIAALRRDGELETALRTLLAWANTSEYEKLSGLAERDDVVRARAMAALSHEPHQEG